MHYSTPYVLLLETEHGLCLSMAELLHQEGLDLKEETDSGQGVARVMEQQPGAILMAEEMAPLDGVELLPLLRRLTKAPIIVLGNGGETAVVSALLQGADMYMKRPLNNRELLSRVRALFRRSSAPKGSQSSALSHTSQEVLFHRVRSMLSDLGAQALGNTPAMQRDSSGVQGFRGHH